MKQRLTISVSPEAYELAVAVASEKKWNMSQVFEHAVLAAHPIYEVMIILGEHGRDVLQVKVNGARIAYVRFAQRNIVASVDCTIVLSGQGQPSTPAIAAALGTRLPWATQLRSGLPVTYSAGGLRVVVTDLMMAVQVRPEMVAVRVEFPCQDTRVCSLWTPSGEHEPHPGGW